MLLSGCESKDDNFTLTIDSIDTPAVFIYADDEYSMIVRNIIAHGYIIENTGDVYSYNFVDMPDDERYSFLKDFPEYKVFPYPKYFVNQENKKYIGHVDYNELLKYYNMSLLIDRNATIKGKKGKTGESCSRFYAVRINEYGNREILLLGGAEGTNITVNDKYAQKIYKWLDSRPVDFYDN